MDEEGYLLEDFIDNLEEYIDALVQYLGEATAEFSENVNNDLEACIQKQA